MKWHVTVQIKDRTPRAVTYDKGHTWEEHSYVHRTPEDGIEAACREFYGDQFIKLVFKERID